MFREGTLGLAVEQQTMRSRDRAAARDRLARAARADDERGRARRGRSQLRPSIVVIDRGANTLKLYTARKLVRTLPRRDRPVGLPDAVGHLHVVDMQANPWWTRRTRRGRRA